jgi:hypothetical protein
MTQLIKQKFNQWFEDEDKSKLSLRLLNKQLGRNGNKGVIRR